MTNREQSNTQNPPRVQYRAVVRDYGDGEGDHGHATFQRFEAEMDLEDLLRSEPPWDGGYIEQRFVSEWETSMTSTEQSDSRRWIEVEQRLFWRVDVTDWLEPGDEGKSDAELQELARGKLDYHECQVGDEAECVGYAWGAS